ncbi:unnamed protein product [Lasius platythorax]|uniref:Uncharacterized protein n=1 Tax=Lasius platythorax TaxID=488582 RepID=A0AAV2P811_9HYME
MLTNEEGAQLKGLMGLPGWQPPCLRARGSFCSCQSGNEGVTATEEREESLPQYVAPSFSLYPPLRETSQSREPCHPPTTPSPWSSRSPGPLPLHICRPSEASASLPSVLPGAASRYSRIPVSPPPSPRCIAAESIPADILTQLEVNASFPRAPTTSTSYLPYPTTSFPEARRGLSAVWGGDFHL